jgi:fructose-1,6-bisphosphatase I
MATNGDMPPVQNEKVNTDIVTLTRFLTEEQAKHKEATGDFTYVYRLYWVCC